MSVKTIFKTIIGTIVTIIMISLCMELFNVNVSGMQIKTVTSMAAKQSAELFTQETYKGVGDVYANTEARSANMKSIYTADGTEYITGKFYGDCTTVSDIWNKLYGTSNNNFKSVCTLLNGNSTTTTVNVGGTNKIVRYSYKYSSSSIDYTDTKAVSRYIHQTYPWAPYKNTNTFVSIYKDLGQLYAGIYDPQVDYAATQTITFEDYINDSDIIRQKSYALNAQKMKSRYYTPVNVGFPYFDPEVVNKIFQWDLAMILSNGTSNSIIKDDYGTYCIRYKGFNCYVQDAYITDFEYYVIDTDTDAAKLRSLTNLDADNLRKVDISEDGTGTLDNRYVTVVGIKYTIPISYIGISPLKKIFEYTWNKEVSGLEGNEMNSISGNRSGMSGTGQYNNSAQNMTNSEDANNGELTTFGTIYYVLVR